MIQEHLIVLYNPIVVVQWLKFLVKKLQIKKEHCCIFKQGVKARELFKQGSMSIRAIGRLRVVYPVLLNSIPIYIKAVFR